MTLTELGKKAKETAAFLGVLSSARKNEGLKAAAQALLEEMCIRDRSDGKTGAGFAWGHC